MRRRIVCVAVLLVAAANLALAQNREVLEGILVRVNDRIITVSDFTMRLQTELSQMPTAPSEEELQQFATMLLEENVNELVLLERAAEKRLEVTEQMVDQSLQNLREENNLQDDEAWAQALESSGLSVEQLRERYRRSILLQRAVQGEIRPVEITEEELRREYEAEIENYSVPEKVELEQVFIPVENTNLGDVSRRAEGMVTRVRGGADLTAEAILAGSQVQELGAIPVADCRPELTAALENIDDGGVTDPMAVPGGVQIIRLVQRIPAGYQPFDEVVDDIRRRKSAETYEGQTRGLVEKLKKDYLVEVHEERLTLVYRNLGGF